MGSSEGNTQADTLGHQAFAAHLSSLKQQGSAILVVGNLPADQYRHACHRMLGDDATASRRRLLVTAGETAASPATRLPAAHTATPYTTTHLHYPVETRDTTGTTVTASPQLPTKSVAGPDLPALGEAISEAINEFQQGTSELSPAELRVCFDSLRPLLSTHDRNAVVRFVYRLIGRITAVQGMGHFHCPVAYGSESVRLLAALFDAVVELRSRDGRLHQRWEFPDKDLASPWLEV